MYIEQSLNVLWIPSLIFYYYSFLLLYCEWCIFSVDLYFRFSRPGGSQDM